MGIRGPQEWCNLKDIPEQYAVHLLSRSRSRERGGRLRNLRSDQARKLVLEFEINRWVDFLPKGVCCSKDHNMVLLTLLGVVGLR